MIDILTQVADVANTHAEATHAEEVARLRAEMEQAFWPMTPGIEAGQLVAPEHRDAFRIVAGYLEADLMLVVDALARPVDCRCPACSMLFAIRATTAMRIKSVLSQLRTIADRDGDR